MKKVYLTLIAFSVAYLPAMATERAPSVTQILQLLSQNDNGQDYCNSPVLTQSIRRASNDYQIGNFIMAQAFAYGAAKNIAYCIVDDNWPVKTTAYLVGNLLYESALSSARAYMVDTQARTIAQYAEIILVKYPSKRSGIFINNLKQAGLLKAQ